MRHLFVTAQLLRQTRAPTDSETSEWPAWGGGARRRVRRVLVGGGLTLLAALAIALALVIAALAQDLGSEPASPPTAPAQIGPSGGGGGGYPVAQ